MLPALLKKTKYMHTVCTNDLWKDTQEVGCAGCLQGTRQGAGVGAKHFIVCLLNPVSCTGMAYLKMKMKRREKDNKYASEEALNKVPKDFLGIMAVFMVKSTA